MPKQKVAFEDMFVTGDVPPPVREPREPVTQSTPTVGAPDKPSRQFIVYSKQIDKFNTLRKRVLLTPAVCNQCGLDLGEVNGIGTYEEMDALTRSKIERTVAKHKEEFHTLADNLIVNEDQIPKEFLNRAH